MPAPRDADGAEALVGGHNLNMDLFRSYPPVHDVSVVAHGDAAYGAQQFLNQMWNCGPDLLAKDKALGDLLQTVHMVLNLVFALAIAGHIGAALKHHFIDRDDILTRMLPGRHPQA